MNTEALGFDVESIKDLSKKQFQEFLKYKSQCEREILSAYPIIVTTSGNAATKAIRDLNIKRVIIDEAT